MYDRDKAMASASDAVADVESAAWLARAELLHGTGWLRGQKFMREQDFRSILAEHWDALEDLSETWDRFIGCGDTPGIDNLVDLARVVVKARALLARR